MTKKRTKINVGNLQKLREIRGMSRQELAKITGLAVVTICKYEIGIRNPLAPTAKKLADALGVQVTDLASVTDEELDTLEKDLKSHSQIKTLLELYHEFMSFVAIKVLTNDLGEEFREAVAEKIQFMQLAQEEMDSWWEGKIP